MNKLIFLVVFVFVAFSAGCTTVPPTNSKPADQVADTSAAEEINAADEVPKNALSTFDLAGFAQAWSSGDAARIHAYYAGDAIFVSDRDVIALQKKETTPVKFADLDLAGYLALYPQMEMVVLGDPVLMEKQLGYFFRWQDANQGYDGVSILRFENGQIWMHTYALSAELTPNRQNAVESLEAQAMPPLYAAWSGGDFEPVKQFYTPNDGVFAVFNDEDIYNSMRGLVHTPQELAGDYLSSEVLSQASQWGMSLVGQPLRLGEFVLMTWRFDEFDYPVAHGIRFLRMDEDKILTDIRYAMRPWEVNGGTFTSGL